MEFCNLTPHAINLIGPGGEGREIPPSGVTPRVPIRREDVGTIDGIPVRRTRLDVEAADPVPPPRPGTVYIVARVVAEAHPDRGDMLFPDELIRDGKGRVVGCLALGTVAI